MAIKCAPFHTGFALVVDGVVRHQCGAGRHVAKDVDGLLAGQDAVRVDAVLARRFGRLQRAQLFARARRPTRSLQPPYLRQQSTPCIKENTQRIVICTFIFSGITWVKSFRVYIYKELTIWCKISNLTRDERFGGYNHSLSTPIRVFSIVTFSSNSVICWLSEGLLASVESCSTCH